MKPLLASALGAAGLALASASPASAQVARGWLGTYEYTEMVPRTGITGTIEYRLTLTPGGGCRIDAQGVMTNLHARCTARSSGNRLDIAFRDHTDGMARDARFRPGTPMLRLTRTPGGLVTQWQGLTRSDARRASGRYFMKRLG